MRPRATAFALIFGLAAGTTALALLAQQPPAPATAGPPSPAVTVREDAYRANNIGVARLEQYDFPAATAAFRRALELDGTLAMARLNLGIALFYAGEQDAARKELESVRTALADRPQVEYVLGLIARSADRTDDAIEAFTRVRKLDPTDVGAAINLGQLLVQARRFDEAIALLQPTVAAEPFNATAAYGLATALVRSGAADEGRVAMERFQKLRESGYAVTFSQAYLEQGRYAEAIASTGAEAGLVKEDVPDVRFTGIAGPEGVSSAEGGGTTLVDLRGDGMPDLFEADGLGLRRYRNTKGQFTFTPGALEAALSGRTTALVTGDCDNDGDADLLLLRPTELTLLRQNAGGTFTDMTREAGLPVLDDLRSAAWLDADHDGDLDLLVGGPALHLFRNNGKAVFEDVTAAAGLGSVRTVAALVPTDYDNRRDIDVLAVSAGRPLLYRNMRDGTFKDVTGEVGLAVEGAVVMAAAGDVNKDGFVDLFFARTGAPGLLAVSDGRGRFGVSTADAATTGSHSGQFIDYDNDGLLDLVAATATGIRLIRNLGNRWMDVTSRALPSPDADFSKVPGALASGDIDGDGDIDFVVRGRSLRIFRNDGGSRARSLRLRLTARVSNRSALGAKIDMRAGSLRQRLETYAATPAPAPADLSFGLGDRAGADVIRVLWPSGILQAEAASLTTPAAPLTGTLPVEELDRKPSSCPFLYTWNGERFEFLTDFLGGGEMGYWLAPGVRNTPDPDEYVRIPGDKLRARNGRLELRVTNELEEAVFLDRAQLVAVAHPEGTAVYPNEGLKPVPEPLHLFVTGQERPLIDARDEHGHDVRDHLERIDRRYPDDFALEPLRGYAAEHSLTLTLPTAGEGGGHRVLLLTGWTDYAFSGDNVAAHQRNLRMVPPKLQVPDGPGRWRTVIEDIGFPVGRPQTVPVDLTGLVSRNTTVVRIVTTMRVYWDRIAVGIDDHSARPVVARLEPVAADLRWRGFSAEQTPDGREPFGYDYGTVTAQSPWKVLPGRYTRAGDVLELLTRADDFFVVSRPGDEIALSFDAARLDPLPDGWTRTFLFYAAGYSKEMNLNSSSPDELLPLPFAAMRSYPYSPADGPASTPARQRYLDQFLTRIVPRPLPPIELIPLVR